MAKPTILPEFATDDLLDPTSGENNVAEPIPTAKQRGWTPYLTKPFRQWMNWLHRHTYLWLKYIDDELEPQVQTNISNIADNASDISTNTGNISTNTGNISTNTANIATNTGNIKPTTSGNIINVHISNNDFAVQKNFSIEWEKYLEFVRIQFPQIIENGSGITSRVDIYPDTSWPIQLITNGFTLILPFVIGQNIGSGAEDYIGAIKTPFNTTTPFEVYNVSAIGQIASRFPVDSTERGFRATSLCYTTGLQLT